MALGRKPIDIVNEGKHQLLVKAPHWERAYLKDVAIVQNGFAFSSKKFVKSGGMPLIRIRDIDKGCTVDRYKGAFSAEYVVKKGDILIGMDGDFKASIWRGGDALLNQRVCRIIPTSMDYDVRFLFLCLQPFLNAINEETSSVTVKHLSSKTIEEIPLPFPPLREQQAIVEKFDELYIELNDCICQMEKAKKQIDLYRQSLLQIAFDKSWKYVSLKHVVDKISDGPFGSHLKTSDYVDKGVRVIRLENISERQFRDDLETYISLEKYESIKKHTVSKGDIIFSSFISDKVRAAILPEHISKAVNKADCFLVRVNEEKILNKFLLYYFSTRKVFSQLITQVHGATRPRINTTQLKEVTIPLPAVEEQGTIIKFIENGFSNSDKIEETIERILKQVEVLKRSILKKAFEGKLINGNKRPQNSSLHYHYLHQVQFLRLVIKASQKENVYHGEMTLAKYSYLVDRIFGVPTFYNYKRWHLGPYPPEIKKAVNNKRFFRKDLGRIDIVEQKKLFEKANSYQREIEKAVAELTEQFLKYTAHERPRKTELLATVCKVIEDIQTTELKAVRKSMTEWKVELKGRKPTNCSLINTIYRTIIRHS